MGVDKGFCIHAPHLKVPSIINALTVIVSFQIKIEGFAFLLVTFT